MNELSIRIQILINIRKYLKLSVEDVEVSSNVWHGTLDSIENGKQSIIPNKIIQLYALKLNVSPQNLEAILDDSTSSGKWLKVFVHQYLVFVLRMRSYT